MHLTSSIGTTGAKSTKHYLVLQYDDRRELILLPKSYLDLEKQVEELFHVGAGRFHVETDELNLCNKQRIRIPKAFWDDVAEILGNLYVVASEDKSNTDHSHPESTTGMGRPANPSRNANEGHISLRTPLVKDEVLLLEIGRINFNVPSSSSTKFQVQLLDGNRGSPLTLNVSPHQGCTFLSSSGGSTSTNGGLTTFSPLYKDHHIIVRKEGTRFTVLFDSQFVGTVETPVHLPITAITYILGVRSPFEGPISANVYPGLPSLIEAFKEHDPRVTVLDRGALYQEFLTCALGNSARLVGVLDTIRNETASFGSSSSGTKWQGSDVPCNQWANIQWNLNSHSMFVCRYHILPNVSPSVLEVQFYENTSFPLRVRMRLDKVVVLSEHIQGSWVDYHTIGLQHAMQLPGEHSVAFVIDGGEIRISFDFTRATVLPRATLLARKPTQLYVTLPVNCTANVDVYDFDQ